MLKIGHFNHRKGKGKGWVDVERDISSWLSANELDIVLFFFVVVEIIEITF